MWELPTLLDSISGPCPAVSSPRADTRSRLARAFIASIGTSTCSMLVSSLFYHREFLSLVDCESEEQFWDVSSGRSKICVSRSFRILASRLLENHFSSRYDDQALHSSCLWSWCHLIFLCRYLIHYPFEKISSCSFCWQRLLSFLSASHARDRFLLHRISTWLMRSSQLT